MDILDILLDILLKPPQPLWGYFCINQHGLSDILGIIGSFLLLKISYMHAFFITSINHIHCYKSNFQVPGNPKILILSINRLVSL